MAALLWLPICAACWYFVTPVYASLLALPVQGFVGYFSPGLVSAIETQQGVLAFVTNIEVHPTPDETALLLPEVDSRLYTFGLPFFIALMLASRARAWALAAGALALVPLQAWGIAFDFLSLVAIKMGPEIALQTNVLGAKREAVALAYQLGVLIFPALAPVVAWGAANRGFIENIRKKM